MLKSKESLFIIEDTQANEYILDTLSTDPSECVLKFKVGYQGDKKQLKKANKANMVDLGYRMLELIVKD